MKTRLLAIAVGCLLAASCAPVAPSGVEPGALDSALEAVSRPGTVVHVTMEFRGVYAYDPAAAHADESVSDEPSSRLDAWVDYAGERVRIRTEDRRDGAWLPVADALILDEVSRRVSEYNGQVTVWESDAREPERNLRIVQSYPEMLRGASARVIGTTDDSVRVLLEDTTEEGFRDVLEVTLDTADYLPTELRIEHWLPVSGESSAAGVPRAGYVAEASVAMEVIEATDVPVDAFELDAPADAVWGVSRELDRDEASAMTSPTVYWLGSEYREAQLTGGFLYRSAPGPEAATLSGAISEHEWRDARFGARHVVAGYWIDGDDRPFDIVPSPAGGESWFVRSPAVCVMSMTLDDVRIRMQDAPHAFEDREAWAEILGGTRDRLEYPGPGDAYVVRRFGDTIVVVLSRDPVATRRAAELVRPVGD